MITFTTDSTYSMRSPGDHNCVWTFRVTRRTASSVWLQQVRNGEDVGDVKRRGISVYSDRETCSPLGTYSMSPILSAERPVASDPAPVEFKTELTAEGEQFVIPGCEENAAPAKTQLNLFG